MFLELGMPKVCHVEPSNCSRPLLLAKYILPLASWSMPQFWVPLRYSALVKFRMLGSPVPLICPSRAKGHESRIKTVVKAWWSLGHGQGNRENSFDFMAWFSIGLPQGMGCCVFYKTRIPNRMYNQIF